MNDEFLHRLRVAPPASFTAKLKERLDAQALRTAAKRRARKWSVLYALLFGVTALAIIGVQVRSFFTARSTSADAVSVPMRSVAQADASEEVDPKVESAAAMAPSQTAAEPTMPTAATAGTPVRSRMPSVYVAFGETPAAVADQLIEEFEATYGYLVERKAVSPGKGSCYWPNPPDVSVTMGRMSDEERAQCERVGIKFIDVPIAYDAYVALVHRENTWANSLTLEDLRVLGLQGSSEAPTTWNQLRSSWPAMTINLFGIESRPQSARDRFASARDARALPILVNRDDARIPVTVDATYGGLGLMTFATFLSQSHEAAQASSQLPVKVVPIVNELGDAVMPSSETISSGRYDTLSRPIVLNINTRTLHREAVLLFCTHAIESTSQKLNVHGYTPIDKLTMDQAARKVRGSSGRPGRLN